MTEFKVKVTAKGQNVNVYPGYLNRQIVTKRSIVLHLHEPESHAKRLVCYFQGQGHSKGS